MAKHDGPLSATYLNPILEEAFRWAYDTFNEVMEEIYASGYPPGTEPLPDYEQFRQLVSLMQAGSPVYWQNADAQEELDTLSERFGAPPPLQAPGMGQMPQGMQPPQVQPGIV